MNCEMRELKSRIAQLNISLKDTKAVKAAGYENMDGVMTELDTLLYRYIKMLGGCNK